MPYIHHVGTHYDDEPLIVTQLLDLNCEKNDLPDLEVFWDMNCIVIQSNTAIQIMIIPGFKNFLVLFIGEDFGRFA